MSGLHRFPFYYQRFLDSTDGWSPEERWHYLRLLIVQFRDGAVDESRLERYSPGVSTHWPAIAAKFERDAEGLLRNPFMAEVRRHVEGERQRSRDRRPTATGVVGSGQTAGQTAVKPPVKVRSNPRSISGIQKP